MTPEDKELLLKDISGRLPYGLIVQISLFRNDGRKGDIELDPHVTENIWEIIDKYHALPYLRPMSSMTEEESKEYRKTQITKWVKSVDCTYGGYYEHKDTIKTFDWLNAHHFDYRGLIKKGLAIEVTKENNLYEN